VSEAQQEEPGGDTLGERPLPDRPGVDAGQLGHVPATPDVSSTWVKTGAATGTSQVTVPVLGSQLTAGHIVIVKLPPSPATGGRSMLGLLLMDDAQVAGSVRCTVCSVQASEIEFAFEPDPDGGYYAYAPELPGLHTEGDTLEEAVSNAEEALALYVEGLREEGRALNMGVVRRTLLLPA